MTPPTPGTPTRRLDFQVRSLRPDDQEFVFSSWLKSNLAGPGYDKMPPETYYHWHHQIIETLMCDGLVAWVMAHAPDDPRFIYGWMCGGQMVRADDGISPIVHFVYVKKNFRRLGVATALLELFGVNREVALISTHRSAAGDQVLAAMRAVALYNPYLAWARLPAMPVQVQNLAGQRTKARKLAFARSRRELGKGGHAPTPRKAT